MYKFIKLLIIVLLITLLFYSYTYNKASALSCAYITDTEHYTKASLVFVGKVLSVDNEKVTFEVNKYWKGNLSNTITTYGTTYWTGYPGGNIFFNLGQDYIVYTYNTNGKEMNSIDCGKTSTYDIALENTLNTNFGSAKIISNPVTPNPNMPIYSYCEYAKDINTNMWLGNKYNNNNQVIALQKFLKSYYGINLKSSGYYGLVTKYYVNRFQREMGIRPSGGVGPITIAKLQNLCNVTNDYNEAPNNCKIWYDGCNTCSRQYPGGPQMCTMMACINNNNTIWNSGAYCREYFSTVNESPVIKSFTGPVILKVGETGTWKIDATSFNNQPITYNISWGDEYGQITKESYANASISAVVTQNSTFEHTYNRAGKFTVTLSATSNGQTTKTTSTVTVNADNSSIAPADCKTWYDGCNTCYRSTIGGPLACTRMYCIQNAGAMCKEYFNQNTTICTADAYQCPNGSWVGRTGPNCQFVCN